MKNLITSILMGTVIGWTLTTMADIIPISAWPRTLSLPGKRVFNASVAECVKAGYRLMGPAPVTPGGKQIVDEVIIQDPDDPIMAKIVRTYEDIPPEPAPPSPEVLTNISADKVIFQFTTNGVFRKMIWIDAPSTNGL